MNLETVRQCLALSILADEQQRRQGETTLRQFMEQPGFSTVLFNLAFDEELPLPERQMAAIIGKNHVAANWNNPSGILTQAERLAIRQNLLPTLLRPGTHRILHRCFLALLRRIAHEMSNLTVEFPELGPALDEALKNPDLEIVDNALLVFATIAGSKQFASVEDRGSFNEILAVFLPRFVALLSSFPTPWQEAHHRIAWRALKSISRSLAMDLPPCLRPPTAIDPWMQIILHVLNTPGRVEPEDVSERGSKPEWKAKKWAGAILEQIVSRYCHTGLNQHREVVAFAKSFGPTYAARVTQALLGQLAQAGVAGTPSRLMCYITSFFTHSIELAVFWKQLKPHCQTFITDVAFPALSFSEADAELWLDCPEEYLQRKNGVFEGDHVAALMQHLLHRLASKRGRVVLHPLITFCNQVLERTRGQNSFEAASQIDGALCIVETLADVIAQSPALRPAAPGLLGTYVFPQFLSQHGFLRARACSCSAALLICVQTDDVQAAQATAMSGILSCLDDPAMPVKVQAAAAIKNLLSEDTAATAVQANLPQVMNALLQILQEHESDTVTDTLEQLLDQFGEQLRPFALQLANHLTIAFTAALDYDPNSKAGEVMALAALGYAGSLKSIVQICAEDSKMLHDLQAILFPLITALLRLGASGDFFGEAWELLHLLVMNDDTPACLQLFPVALEAACSPNAYDEVGIICSCLAEYLSKEAVQQNPTTAQGIMQFVSTVLGTPEALDEAFKLVARLTELTVCLLPPSPELALLIAQAFSHRLLASVEGASFRVSGVSTMVAALFRDVNNLTALEAAGVGAPIWEMWFSLIPHCIGLHHRKLWISALSNCLNPNVAATSQCIQSAWPQLLSAILILFEGLPAAQAAFDEVENWESDEDEGEVTEETEKMADLEQLSDDEDEDDVDDDFLAQSARAFLNVKDGPEEQSTDVDMGITMAFTPIMELDVHEHFASCFTALQAANPALHQALCASLTPEQTMALQALLEKGAKHRNAAESKELAGTGYQFTEFAVPKSFNFGGDAQQ